MAVELAAFVSIRRDRHAGGLVGCGGICRSKPPGQRGVVSMAA